MDTLPGVRHTAFADIGNVCLETVPREARRGSRLIRKQYRGFNPRAPHGARRGTGANGDFYLLFQSTRPARGATPAFAKLAGA